MKENKFKLKLIFFIIIILFVVLIILTYQKSQIRFENSSKMAPNIPHETYPLEGKTIKYENYELLENIAGDKLDGLTIYSDIDKLILSYIPKIMEYEDGAQISLDILKFQICEISKDDLITLYENLKKLDIEDYNSCENCIFKENGKFVKFTINYGDKNKIEGKIEFYNGKAIVSF